MEQGCASDRSQIPAINYLAHVRRNDDGSFVIHELEEHLRGVGEQVSPGVPFGPLDGREGEEKKSVASDEEVSRVCNVRKAAHETETIHDG
jgi:hypothetical protein